MPDCCFLIARSYFTLVCILLVVGTSACANQSAATGYLASVESPARYFSKSIERDLLDATCRGDLEAISALVSQGADVNARGSEGMTPLIFSMLCKSLPAYSLLMELGADPDLGGRLGPEEGRYYPAIMNLAAPAEQSIWLAKALENGGDPNLESDTALVTGKTIIYGAILHGRHENVGLLLAAGADPNFSPPSGISPMAFAMQQGQWGIAVQLADSGASLNDQMAQRSLDYDRKKGWLPPSVLTLQGFLAYAKEHGLRPPQPEY